MCSIFAVSKYPEGKMADFLHLRNEAIFFPSDFFFSVIAEGKELSFIYLFIYFYCAVCLGVLQNGWLSGENDLGSYQGIGG